jgi:hypothetical protein
MERLTSFTSVYSNVQFKGRSNISIHFIKREGKGTHASAQANLLEDYMTADFSQRGKLTPKHQSRRVVVASILYFCSFMTFPRVC